jgi:hypothetical protein
MIEIIEIFNEIDKLLPQLQEFVHKFYDTVNVNNINVITDSSGALQIDVPSSMTPIEERNCVKKIGILDRLIINHKEKIEELISKGYDIEKNMKTRDNDYISVLKEKSKILKELNYKH